MFNVFFVAWRNIFLLSFLCWLVRFLYLCNHLRIPKTPMALMLRMPTIISFQAKLLTIRLIFALLMLCGVAVLRAQNIVEGTVLTDSLSPNARCTVTLYDKDDKQWQALACDEKGKYRVENVPSGPIRVEAKAIGHVAQSKKVFLFGSTKMQVDFTLKSEAINLKEVEVKSSPMIVNGDTTTYIVSRFTTGREKVLKDVVNNLPGVRYDEKDNSLTVNGKRVSKVLVQGEDLYQGNVSTPMENLPASGVDNLKVIDNYSEYNVFSGFQSSNQTVVDLSMNKSMRGRIKGQAEAQGGLLNKAMAKGSAMLLGKRMMGNLIAGGNNTGEQLMKPADIVNISGGYSELLSGDDPMANMRKAFTDYAMMLDYRENVYRRNNGLVSLNTVSTPGKNTKILWNGMVGADRYRMKSIDHYAYQGGLAYTDSTLELQDKRHFLSNIKFKLANQKNMELTFTNRSYFGTTDGNADRQLQGVGLNEQTKGRMATINNALVWLYRHGKNVFSYKADLNFLFSNNRYDFSSLPTPVFKSPTLHSEMNIRRLEFSGSAQYVRRFADDYFLRIALRHGLQTFSTTVKGDSMGMDNPALKMPYRFYDNGAELSLNKDLGKFRFGLGGIFHHFSLRSSRPLSFGVSPKMAVSPLLNLTYRVSMMHYMELRLKSRYELMGAGEVFDGPYISDFRGVSYAQIENALAHTTELTAMQVYGNLFKGITLFNMVSLSYNHNALAYDYSMTDGLVSRVVSRNVSGGKGLSLVSMIEKKLVSTPLNFRLFGGLSLARSPFFYQGVAQTSNNRSFNLNFNVKTYYKHGFNGELLAAAAWANNKSELLRSHQNDYRLEGELGYIATKWQATVRLGQRWRKLSGSETDYTVLRFGMEYDLNKHVRLKASAQDMLNLKERLMQERVVDNYYVNTRNIHYMPGNVMIGAMVNF